MAALDEKMNRPQVTMIRKAGLWKSGGLPTIFSLCELMIASVARLPRALVTRGCMGMRGSTRRPARPNH